MINRRMFLITLSLLLVSLLCPLPSAFAAYLELSPSAKRALDETARRAGKSTGDRLQSLYVEFLTTQKQEEVWDRNMKSIREANTETEKVLLASIRAIDAELITKLEQELKLTKQRYQPLLDQYAALGKQAEAAKKAKSKELRALIQAQMDLMKPAVQAARFDIKQRQEKLQKAKESAAGKKKALRAELAKLDSIKARSKALRQSAAESNKHKTALWKTLQDAVKRNDATEAASSLASMTTLTKQALSLKQQVHAAETQLSRQLKLLQQRLE